MANATDAEELAHLQWNISRGLWEVGLFTASPGEAGTLTAEVQNTGSTAYARQLYTFSDPVVSRPVFNDNVIEFLNMPQVLCTHWGLFLQGDPVLRYHASLTTSIQILAEGNAIRAPQGALRLDAD